MSCRNAGEIVLYHDWLIAWFPGVRSAVPLRAKFQEIVGGAGACSGVDRPKLPAIRIAGGWSSIIDLSMSACGRAGIRSSEPLARAFCAHVRMEWRRAFINQVIVWGKENRAPNADRLEDDGDPGPEFEALFKWISRQRECIRGLLDLAQSLNVPRARRITVNSHPDEVNALYDWAKRVEAD